MKFSLLFNDINQRIADTPAAVSDGLLLDKLLTEFEPSPDRRYGFLRVLASRSDRGSAYRRQAVMRDFLDKPKLLDDLREMFTAYDGLRKDWQELRSALGAYASLKATADFIRGTISYFKSVHDLLGEYALSSEGLLGLKTWLLEMSRNDSLDELNRVAEMFRLDTLDAYEWSIRARFDGSLAVTGASITALDEIVETPLLKRIFRRKNDDGSIDLGEFHTEQSRALHSEALYELYRAMTAVAGALYEVFHGLSAELDFFTTAVKFCSYLDEKGMSRTFPELSDSLSAECLYDPLLLAEGLTKTQIVTNNVSFGDFTGIIIRGENAAGKTSFIRALGLLSLFAAAGLPVCAERASVPFFDYVYAQFSKSEQLGKLDEAGRFEQEVKELSEIYADAGPGELVLLNETFQTTAYAEGADAIRHILDALEKKRGARWIFVTHLTPLLESPPEGAVMVTMRNFSF